MSNTYTLTFRGNVVRFFGSPSKRSWTSIYPEQFVVLTYRKHLDGSVDMDPTIFATYKTVETARRTIRESPSTLNRWEGQSFIVRVTPGTTEVTEAEVFPIKKGA